MDICKGEDIPKKIGRMVLGGGGVNVNQVKIRRKLRCFARRTEDAQGGSGVHRDRLV